jgi:hypothetical protein
MTAGEFLIIVLALLIYSGPFVPLLAPLFFRRASRDRFRRNAWALVVLSSIQALSFLPYVLAVSTDTPDSLYRLYLPFFLGIPMFVATSVYAICECVRLRSLIHSHHAA